MKKTLQEATNELFYSAKEFVNKVDCSIWEHNVAFIRLKQAIEEYEDILTENFVDKMIGSS